MTERGGQLAVEGVSFSYPEGEQAVRDLSFSLAEGEMVGLLGPNGAGKTTILKLMNGLLRPGAGRISVLDRDLDGIGRRDLARRMAVVHQRHRTFFPFTVGETVAMGRWPHLGRLGLMRERDRLAVSKAMSGADVYDLRDRRLEELSGGERQRVMIARALAQETRMLLMDEPVSHLDVRHQYGVLDLLRGINRREGISVLLILHDLNLAAQFCRRIAVLARGSLVAQGSPEEVLAPDLLEEVFGVRAEVDKNPINGRLRVTVGGEIGEHNR